MDFKIHWMGKRKEVVEFVKETLGKDKAAVAALPNVIHFRDLLEEAKETYTDLQHLWGNAPPSKEQALVSQLKALQAKLDKMDQQLKAKPAEATPNGGTQRERACFNCGDKNHLAKDCPNKGKNGGSNNGNQGKGEPGNGGNSGGSGKWARPKDGEKHEKEFDGVLMHWCGKCRDGRGRWNKTHKTAGHKTKEELAAEKAAKATAKVAALDICQELHSSWFGG